MSKETQVTAMRKVIGVHAREIQSRLHLIRRLEEEIHELEKS